MTDLTTPIIDLKPNSCIEFRINSKDQIEAKFRNLTISGIPYAGEYALEYLEFKSNQKLTPIEFIKQGQVVPIHTGQFLTTIDTLMGVFNWTEKKVRYWLSKWAKKGILSLKTIKNKLGHKIGTLITSNKLIEFRQNFQNQYQTHTENQKKLSQKWGGRFIQFNQGKLENGADKIIKENTYKNNIGNQRKNSLSFEAQKRVYEMNAELMLEKREQEKELFNLKILLKKEKTLNNQLKSLKRFEVKGQVKSDTIVFDWSFQDTVEYIQIAEKLKSFGFSQFTINKIWWKHSLDLVRLQDYIDYTQMRFDRGKVTDRKKFLYQALNANYDIGELEKMRWAARSQEEKDRIEQERRAEELKLKDNALEAKKKQEAITAKHQQIVRSWIVENPDSSIFEEVYADLENGQYKFWFDRLILKAREKRVKPIEILKTGELSYGDLISFGLWNKITKIVTLEINSACGII